MLSTKVYTNVIKTYSGSVYFLTAEDNNRLSRVGNNDWFQIDDQKIKGSNISEILTTAEYYKQNPESKPISYETYKAEDYKTFTKKSYLKGLENMIKGFKANFKDRDMPENSKEMLKRMWSNYKKTEKLPDDKKIEPTKMFGYNN